MYDLTGGEIEYKIYAINICLWNIWPDEKNIFWIHNYYVIEMNNHKIDGLEQSVFYLVSEPILANLILQGSLQYRISQDSGMGIGKKWEAV